MSDFTFIQRCNQIAAQAGPATGLNPLVGAMLVRNGSVVAEGHHTGWGKPHAEVELLDQTVIQPHDVLYVNLEPCCHTGKTPPCTDFIIQKGVKTVVYGMQDPNPKVAGQGIQCLQDAGITVIGPVLPELCQRLNKGYVSVVTKKRPYITLKSAQTPTGEYANADGSPRCITSAEQDTWSHQHLRATHAAMLVGVETILSDNPALTVRHAQVTNQPYRMVLDPTLRMPLDAALVTDTHCSQTIVVTSAAKEEYAQVLQKRGVRVWHVPLVDGLFDFTVLWKHCLTPADDFPGISSILVEGGPTTWAACRVLGCRDEEVQLIGS